MKLLKTLLLTAAMLAFGSASFAADLGGKPAPKAAPTTVVGALEAVSPAFGILKWTGGYAGISFGAALGNINQKGSTSSATLPADDISFFNGLLRGDSDNTDFAMGVHAGWGVALPSGLYMAPEVGLDYLTGSFKNSRSGVSPGSGDTTTVRDSSSTSLIASLRARLGYVAFSNRVLFYALLGPAITDIHMKSTVTDNTGGYFQVEKSTMRLGYVAGLGAEVFVTDDWTIRGEWIHAGFGRVKSTYSIGGDASIVRNSDIDVDMFRVGLTRRF